MEKSSWKADTTKTKDARNTAANAAIPARRAVSERRSEVSPGDSKAHDPTRKEYPLRTNAIRRARLPSSAMMDHTIFSETDGGGNSIGHAEGRQRRKHKTLRRLAKVLCASG